MRGRGTRRAVCADSRADSNLVFAGVTRRARAAVRSSKSGVTLAVYELVTALRGCRIGRACGAPGITMVCLVEAHIARNARGAKESVAWVAELLLSAGAPVRLGRPARAC